MMIFPKREAVYQNLNTSFTNFGELLVDLKENGFTGVVQVSYWEYEGVLLLDNGNIVNGVQDINGNVITGQEAVKSVTDKANEKDGAISVYHQKGEMITMLASVARSEVIYGNLSAEFTSLEALISKLQNEDHTGYIEVTFPVNDQKGYIFLLAGEVIEALFSARSEDTPKETVLSQILNLTATSPALFNVYQAGVEDALSESEVIKVSYNLPQLLEVWGAVIGAIESTADRDLGKNEFLNTFKDTLIANADDYPFLDPFAAKFQYKDGVVTFSGEVRKNFSQAIGICLTETVNALAERMALDGKDLYGPVRDALVPVKNEHQEKISRFNFAGLLPDLLE
jgi:hypothetical protein